MNTKKIIDALDISALEAIFEYKENLLHVGGLKFTATMADLDAEEGEIIIYGAMIDAADAYIELGRMPMINSISTLKVMFPFERLYVVVDYDSTSIGTVTLEMADAAMVRVESIVTKSFEITRPANTTDYAVGDVIANSDSAPVLPYVEISDAAGIGLMLAQVRIQTNNTAFAGATIRLHVYTDEVTAINDNAAFQMLYANAAKRVGYIDVTLDAANAGSTDSVAGINNFDKLMLQTAKRKLYFMPEIRTVKTPASGQKFMVQCVYVKAE